MPAPTGPRHPLFLRLQKPIDPIYPDAVTAVAWDDYEPIEKAEGVVYIVTRPCPKLRTWAAQMRKLHRVDDTYKTADDICRLGVQPIHARNLGKVGLWTVDFFDAEYASLKSARRAWHLNIRTTLMAVVLDRVDGNAVGFVSFILGWDVPALMGGKRETELELEPDQAWIAPEFRYRGWGSTAAIAIAFATKQHIDQIERTTRWPGDYIADLKIAVGADVYSTSGDRWLRSFAQYVSLQFDLSTSGRIEVTEIELESRI